MLPSIKAVCIARVLAVALLLSTARGWRHYLTSIPNSDLIPCPDVILPAPRGGASVSPACLKGYCEAIGHDGCSPTGEINDFGQACQDEELAWTLKLCSADHDSDGYTNGDELGDGCCVWQGDKAALLSYRTPDTLSNPASDVSRASAPQCSASAPDALASFNGFGITDTAVQIYWSLPSSCACEFSVNVTGINGFNRRVQVRGDTVSSVLCDLPASSQLNLSITAINRAGSNADADGQGLMLTLSTLAHSSSTIHPQNCEPWAPIDAAIPSKFMNTIPQGGYKPSVTIPVNAASSPVALVVAPMLVIVVIGLVMAAAPKYKVIGCARLYNSLLAAMPCKYCLSKRCMRSPWTRDMVQTSNAFLFALLTAIIGVSLAWATSSRWYDENMIYSPAQVKSAALRGCGYALAICMGLQILPITRWSPWMHMMGISFDRAVMFHRWVSSFSFVLAAIHGIGFAVEYGKSPLGLAYIFRWSADVLPVNPLAGTLAGFALLAMAVLSIGPVRRQMYTLFLIGHAFYPFALALSILHIDISETPALPLLLPGIVCLILDHTVFVLDFLLRPTVVSLIKVGPPSSPCSVVHMECYKRSRWAWVNWFWRFNYEPGQFIYLVVPSVSLIPHPFSISSAPDSSRPGWFSIHIRVMGPGSFTDRLLKCCRDTLAFSHRSSSRAETVEMAPVDAKHVNAEADADAGEDVLPERPTVEASPAPAGRFENPLRSAGATGAPASAVKGNGMGSGGGSRRGQAARVEAPAIIYALPVIVTGAYGFPSIPLWKYKHFVLFGGGIGVTPIVSLRSSLLTQDSSTHTETGRMCCRHAEQHVMPLSIVTAWAAREQDMLDDLSVNLRDDRNNVAQANMEAGASADAGTHTMVTTLVCCREQTPQSITSISDAAFANFDTLPPFRDGLFIVKARLDAKVVLARAIDSIRQSKAPGSGGATQVAVVVCGPQTLVDDVYRAVAEYPQEGGDLQVHVHKELFAF